MDGRTLRYQHRRPELLAAAAEYVLDHGISGLSLRPMAEAIGVSHATLLRHFTSKEDLLIEVLDTIRHDLLAHITGDGGIQLTTSSAELLRSVWRRLSQPREQRQFVLLFELVGGPAQKLQSSERLLTTLITEWLTPLRDSLIRDGRSPKDASDLATLILAQVRGLQLDLLVSGDRVRVNRAFEAGIALLERS
jgi:AcrR family transcriptional regulator